MARALQQVARSGATRRAGSSRQAVRPKATAAAEKPIEEGQELPDATVRVLDSKGEPQETTAKEMTKGKKVVLFAVPGAFTPTCSQQHLPGFKEKADEIKNKGVASIMCVSVNDPFVMKEWKQNQGVGDEITFVADGAAELTKAMGVHLDLADKGLGLRSRRYAMIVEDSKVTKLLLEQGGEFDASSAENILASL